MAGGPPSSRTASSASGRQGRAGRRGGQGPGPARPQVGPGPRGRRGRPPRRAMAWLGGPSTVTTWGGSSGRRRVRNRLAEVVRDGPRAERPSTGHGTWSWAWSARVGSRSTCSQLRLSTPGPALAGLLDEQRHPHDPGGVAAADHPRVGARPEADAVVGGDDHQRPLVQAGGPHGGEHLAEQPVGPGQLEAVALQREPGPGHLVAPGGALGGQAEGPGRLRVVQARRQRPPRPVGQQQVQVVQPRGVRGTAGMVPRRIGGSGGPPGWSPGESGVRPSRNSAKPAGRVAAVPAWPGGAVVGTTGCSNWAVGCCSRSHGEASSATKAQLRRSARHGPAPAGRRAGRPLRSSAAGTAWSRSRARPAGRGRRAG